MHLFRGREREKERERKPDTYSREKSPLPSPSLSHTQSEVSKLTASEREKQIYFPFSLSPAIKLLGGSVLFWPSFTDDLSEMREFAVYV